MSHEVPVKEPCLHTQKHPVSKMNSLKMGHCLGSQKGDVIYFCLETRCLPGKDICFPSGEPSLNSALHYKTDNMKSTHNHILCSPDRASTPRLPCIETKCQNTLTCCGNDHCLAGIDQDNGTKELRK